MQAKLIPLDNGETIEITRDVTVVGRKRGLCDLVINHPSVSKLHCVVARTDGLLFIRDLGSTNGTKVNGQRVLRGAILPGDELAFAKVKFKVFMGPDVQASPTPPESIVQPSDRTEPALPMPLVSEDADSEEFDLLDEDLDEMDQLLELIDDDDD